MHIFRLSGNTVIAVHLYCEVTGMAKFRIPSIPPTTNKTIRFPNDVIEQVEAVIAGKDCTFSAFVIAAVRNALAELDEHAE